VLALCDLYGSNSGNGNEVDENGHYQYCTMTDQPSGKGLILTQTELAQHFPVELLILRNDVLGLASSSTVFVTLFHCVGPPVWFCSKGMMIVFGFGPRTCCRLAMLMPMNRKDKKNRCDDASKCVSETKTRQIVTGM
jgi:hypothetical protein